jgi:plasmanylethanolamine desaturase
MVYSPIGPARKIWLRQCWPHERIGCLLLNENTLRAPQLSERFRPAWAPLLEASGIGIWITLWLSYVYRVMSGPPSGLLLAISVIVVGIVAADGMSGFVHWFFDTFLEETTPIIGAQLVAPFREHHRDPLALTRHGFFELNGNSCLGFLPAMMALWWFGPVEPRTHIGVCGYLFVLSFCFALGMTNQLHSWAHASEPPRIGRALQRLGLAVSPEQHVRHHAPPHRSSYCVTTGWVNGFADRFSLFNRAERVFVALGIPRRISED